MFTVLFVLQFQCMTGDFDRANDQPWLEGASDSQIVQYFGGSGGGEPDDDDETNKKRD